MLFGVFLTLGVVALSVGLRSFQNSYAQKAGALGILAATFLAVYFVTGSLIWGFAAAMGWLFLPWLEILTRIRALRLPKEKQLRKPERTNARKNFQPREKKPTHCGGETPDPAAGNKINRKKSGSKDSERARFLCIRILKTAQADAEHDHAECKEDAKKHYGLIWCSLRNFSS